MSLSEKHININKYQITKEKKVETCAIISDGLNVQREVEKAFRPTSSSLHLLTCPPGKLRVVVLCRLRQRGPEDERRSNLLRLVWSVRHPAVSCLVKQAGFLLWRPGKTSVRGPDPQKRASGWSYLEGLYFSFITLTTVGFGDYVAGVNPNIEYPKLYRVFAEIWIYMGLAWLSLFFSWNVNMVVEAHKVLKNKRRHKRRRFRHEEPKPEEKTAKSDAERPTAIDIFSFLSDKEEDYSTVIKEIGMSAKPSSIDVFNRSKSCSDILTTNIEMLDHSPRHGRLMSISEVFLNPKDGRKRDEAHQEDSPTTEPAECAGTDHHLNGETDSPNDGIFWNVPASGSAKEEIAQPSDRGNRFTISKVVEEDELLHKDEKG
ncbi:uncharacterized protein LOC144022690 isoform X2 [Festucalex cinctus]